MERNSMDGINKVLENIGGITKMNEENILTSIPEEEMEIVDEELIIDEDAESEEIE